MGSQRRNQRNEFFSRWLCLRFGIHRILESKSDSAVEKILHGCLREKMQPNLASYRNIIQIGSRFANHTTLLSRFLLLLW
jgi:hypothetical protein